MAAGGQDKTEMPTPKRLQEARKKGQVARSMDLNSAVILLVTAGVLAFSGSHMYNGLQSLMREGLLNAGNIKNIDPNVVMTLFWDMIIRTLSLTAPLAGFVAVAMIVLGLVQTRFNFSGGALKPQFNRLNPWTGVKRIFGLQGLVEMLKNVFKLALIGGVAFLVLKGKVAELAGLVGISADTTLAITASLVLRLMFIVGLAYLVIAIADYFYQRYETTKSLKMTKEEVRQEFKQSEISQEVKGLIKRRQQEAAQQRMMGAVPEADVVVTNPTHYAVALAYSGEDLAPRVVAKGVDLIAFQIRDIADQHEIEVIPNPPLARALYAEVEIGDFIPGELFAAVAELLAYVYRLKGVGV